MLSCKEITKLVSESLDHPLPLSKRMSVWMHLGMCRLCSAFRRDQVVLQERIKAESTRLTHSDNDQSVTLSAEAKQRIRKLMESK